MLPEIDGYNALQFAEKIRKLVEKTEFKFEDTRIPVTVSIGVATLDAEPDRDRRADQARRRAPLRGQASGRNRVCAASPPHRLRAEPALRG